MTWTNIWHGLAAWVIVNVFLVGFLVVERWLQDRAARNRVELDPFAQWEQDFEVSL